MHDLERLKRLAEANDVDAIAMLAVYVKRSNDQDLKTYLLGLISVNISKRGHEINRLHEIEQMVLKNPEKEKTTQELFNSFLRDYNHKNLDNRTFISSSQDPSNHVGTNQIFPPAIQIYLDPAPEFLDPPREFLFRDVVLDEDGAEVDD